MFNNNYVLCHYHIFKNAGTSLDAALRKHFGEEWTTFEGSNAHDIQSSLDLLNFLSANPAIKAVSSHLARPPTPKNTVLPVAFLRDPLTRARSVYEFTRLDATQPFRDAAMSTFADYLRWAFSGQPGGVVIRDYQVIHLSSASFHERGILYAKETESHYDEAFQLLDSWPVIGIVDKYAQSIKLIEKIYRQYFPNLELNYAHENITTVNNQIEKIREEIGEELYIKFCEQNELDYRLYEFARKKLKLLCEVNAIA
jgi:hypothetical protein